MKYVPSLKRILGWTLVLALGCSASFLYDFSNTPKAQASGGLNVSIQGQGVNGAFTLSVAGNSFINTGNPIPIPADGNVSFTMSWSPTSGFNPQTCSALSRSKQSNNGIYPGNTVGSGFFSPQVTNLPTTEVNYPVQGTLVADGTAQRQIELECDDTVNHTYYRYDFIVIFQAPANVTGECVPAQSNYMANYNNNSSTVEVWNVGAFFGDNSSYGRDDGGRGLLCSETHSTIEPEAFCGERCQNYDPARSFTQADGSYKICNNIDYGNPNNSDDPLNFGFQTYVTGPTSQNITLTQGAQLPLNVQLYNQASGEVDNYIRVGNWLGQFHNDRTTFADPFEASWVFTSSETDRTADNSADAAWSTAYGTAGGAGVSYRPSNDCRSNSVAARTVVDPGNSTNETYSYFQQQYRRDGQRVDGSQNRLWGPELKALYPFVQAQAPAVSLAVTGGQQGTDYTVNTTQPSPSQTNNTLTFNTPGTYTVRLNQDSFSGAIMACAAPINSGNQPNPQNPPYNCGAHDTRIQQFRGAQFPAMTMVYNVTVNPSQNTPDAQLTINGVTADSSNPSRATTVALSAGADQNPITDTLAASWNATNVPANTCKVTRNTTQNNITITTEPWLDQQTGLPDSNASAPLTFGNILRGATTNTTFNLICGSGAQTVTRSVTVQLSRDGSLPLAALALNLQDPRSGDTVTADANTPNATGEFDPYASGDVATFTASYQGNLGLYDNQCTVSPVGATPNSVTITGEPWQSGAANQPVDGGTQTITVNNLNPGTSALLQFAVSCRQLSDGSSLTRTVGLTVRRANVPPPTYTISGAVHYTTGSPAVNYLMSIGNNNVTNTDVSGLYSFLSLANGAYTVTVQPGPGESCVNSCSQQVTIAGADVPNVNFVIQGQSGGGSGNGDVLNAGFGSRSWSR